MAEKLKETKCSLNQTSSVMEKTVLTLEISLQINYSTKLCTEISLQVVKQNNCFTTHAAVDWKTRKEKHNIECARNECKHNQLYQLFRSYIMSATKEKL